MTILNTGPSDGFHYLAGEGGDHLSSCFSASAPVTLSLAKGLSCGVEILRFAQNDDPKYGTSE